MTVLLVLAVVAVGLVLMTFLVVRRRPAKHVEAQQLSAYHDGLDALTRLDARRTGRS
jgi:hypothetical protein